MAGRVGYGNRPLTVLGRALKTLHHDWSKETNLDSVFYYNVPVAASDALSVNNQYLIDHILLHSL